MMDEQLRLALLIARFALRRSAWALLGFGLGLFAFQLSLILGYQLIGGQRAVQSVVETLSPELRRALKIAPALQGGFGPREYVALGLYHPVYLGIGAAFAVSRAAEALAGAVERGTALLVLSRPVGRAALVLGEALALVVGSLLVTLAGFGGLALGLALSDLGLTAGPYLAAGLMGGGLFAVLALLALAVSAACSRIGSAAGWATALALGGFVLDLLPWTGGPPLAWINPWHWYDPPGLIASGFDWRAAAVLLAMALVAALLALGIWQRRDVAG